ncbi:blue-light-activated protein [Geobacter sp. OR-1]|uniref:PAS domain-containing protein n=1 Tax=Geobacter sp. OR-1 TaxID=1266765 RepID=UPI00054210E4|nr:PAS domain-containing protein [Geobacter sp. OR-1]GAM10889.1 blue-light-activated protein [Geobacter sp. OR-1]
MSLNKIDSIPDYRLLKRVVIIAVAALILVSAAFFVWKSIAEYRLTIHGAELQTRGYASALNEHAGRALNEADTVLQEVIKQVATNGGISAQSSESLRRIASAQVRITPQVASIILVNRNGLLFAHSLDAPVRQADVTDRDYFIHHRDNPSDTPYLSKPLKSRINGKWRITLSRPIRNAKGEFDGVAAVALDLDYFRKFYESLDLGDHGKIVMVRKDGVLLLAVPYKESDFAIDFKKSHLIRTHLPRSPIGTFHIPKGKALLESTARIISYASLDEFPVVAMANMDEDEVLSQWQQSALIQAVLVIAVSAALSLLAAGLLRQLRRIEESNRVLLQQQGEIVRSAEAWQTTFDAVADAIWVMDNDRVILRANKATEQIFGKPGEPVVGRRCCEVAHSNATPFAGCPFQKMLDSGHRASMQIMHGQQWYDVTVDPIRNDAGAITGAVHIVSDITELKLVEEQALENETRILGLLSAIPDAIFFKDAAGRWLLANNAGIELFRLQAVDYFGKTDSELAELVPERREALLACRESDRAAWEQQCRTHSEETITDPDGTIRVFDTIKIPLYKTDGSRRGMLVVERDISDQLQMEMQLRQAQKMEAIGHLAGGIAHDFNNLLTPILGYAEMVAARLQPGDPLGAKMAGISAAAHKAKDLTQQLLSFGRRQAVATAVIDLNEIIESFYIVLRRTIRESISIDLALDPAGAFIAADRSQMEQVILNLTVNAQDALGGKGTIAIETCKLFMDGESARLHPGMMDGDYILLAFHDSGCGMSSEVLAHIFEPFFTTKPAGHGTGLGLATVYGIVKQHNGHVSVLSREHEGTTFRIYLPAAAELAPVETMAPVAEPVRDHGEITVLVVEDNEMVRDMVREMLEGYSYRVLTAADGNNAIQVAADNRDKIDLLVSDIVMPGINGPELYEQLLLQIPSLRVVYISGYPMNPSLRKDTLEEEVNYLQKPFTAEALLERIRMVL